MQSRVLPRRNTGTCRCLSARAKDKQQQNAEDRVMDVASAAGFNVVEWAPPGADGVRNNTNDGEGQEESCGRDEVALAAAFSKVPAIVMRQASEGAREQDQREHRTAAGDQQPEGDIAQKLGRHSRSWTQVNADCTRAKEAGQAPPLLEC